MKARSDVHYTVYLKLGFQVYNICFNFSTSLKFIKLFINFHFFFSLFICFLFLLYFGFFSFDVGLLVETVGTGIIISG